jgi:CheY-like chemotaxis protein
VANNGQEAVKLFQSWRPHLIWMDHRMPLMTGVDAAKAIRALPNGAECKIVAVTASAFKEERSELMAAGMDDFVRKPYRFNEIYDCLTRQLGLSYHYLDTPPEERDVVETLTRDRLSGLPEDLRTELKAALESLDADRIADIVQRIQPIDRSLYVTVAHLVANFDYPTILTALKTERQGP